MQQLTIFDFITNLDALEIIKRYLISHGKGNEYYIYQFDNYSEILNGNTRISVSSISYFAPCRVDMYFFNGNRINFIRFFNGNCIIEEENYGSHNFDVLSEVIFKNYDESKEKKLMEKFLDWYRDLSN